MNFTKSQTQYQELFPGQVNSILPRQKDKFLLQMKRTLLVLFAFLLGPATGLPPIYGQTDQGELEERAAPVFRRICVGGANAGNLCNQDGDCPGSTCIDRNIFNISVAVMFNATAAELTTIQNAISTGSADLFDATDGQAEIGLATIHNNTFSTGATADVRIFPRTNPTGWVASTGNWKVGGSIRVSIDQIETTANPGEAFAHEFLHLAFDLRDEYESRAIGCGASSSGFSCPDAAAIAAGALPCLMDEGGRAGDFSDLCWGQGDPANLTDLSAGNHDATNITEQSSCRNNRSCWAQVIWSWPNTFRAPTGMPDPDANGAVVNPTQFVLLDNTMRVVLVLDESNSMRKESPARMERLRVAAKDFIALAANGTEVGIVSYSDDAETGSGHTGLAINALTANRTTWNTAIDNLTPGGWTNIGDGLQKALDMINAAGGATANTAVLLMSDGINNRPSPQATADTDLQSKIAELLVEGIPVFVTCTGGDLGLSSQCSEIAAGTGGLYVDSADPAQLAEAFVDIHERLSRRDAIASYYSWRDENQSGFFVEKQSESASFVLAWQNPDPSIQANMFMIDPAGTTYKSEGMPQGRFLKIDNPVSGDWQMRIAWKSQTSPGKFVKRGYSRNPIHSLNAGLRYPTVLPGNEMHVYAYPSSNGGAITNSSERITATVLRPDGTVEYMELHDMGRLVAGADDMDGDGVFTGVYSNTNLKGSYEFLLKADIDRWPTSLDNHDLDTHVPSARFTREARISGAVGDPNDVVDRPEDTPEKEECPEEKGWPVWKCILLFFLGLLIGLLLCWFWKKRG